ncbi:MAG: electron transfer flavoprotein subunit beta/FixA family protein [Planctomycetaceae bacterium]
MKILVSAKRVPDPDQPIRVAVDGRTISDTDLSFIINPFDAIAVEEALRIREQQSVDTEVVVIGIGCDAYESELRTALAMGADRALLVESDQDLDPWCVALVLQAVVLRESPDLVLLGKQAVDDDSNQVGQFLAALLNWPQATFASQINCVEEGLQVVRETDSGNETLRIPLPAVVTADLRLNEPRYASLPGILKSRSKPIDHLSLAELDVTDTPRIEIVSLQEADARGECVMLDTAAELVRRLREETAVV